MACGERVPGVVVEQLRGDAGRDPCAAQFALVRIGRVPKQLQRTLEDRGPLREAVGVQHGETVDEHVGRARRLRSGRRSASGLRRGDASVAESAGAGGRLERFQVGLTRCPDIEGLERSGRVDEQLRRVGGAADVQCDLSAQALRDRAVELIERALRRGRDEVGRSVGQTDQPLRPRRRQRTLGAASWLGRELGGALEERGGGSETSTRLRPAGGGFQVVGHVLVQRKRRVCSVPGAAVRVERRIGDRRKLAVRASPLLGRHSPVDGRPKKWMPEGDSRPDLDQVGLYRRSSRVGGNAESRSGAPEQQRIAERLGGGNEEQLLGLRGQPADSAEEARFDTARERHRVRTGEATDEARRRDAARELEERQRVAAALRDDPIEDALVERPKRRRCEQLTCLRLRESGDPKLPQAGEPVGRAHVPHREDHEHALRLEAPGDEREDLGRGVVEPLRIVDQGDERLRLRTVRQQAQHREADEETIGWRPCGEAERSSERVALRRRQPLESLEQRQAELMEGREGQLHLRLDADGPDHPALLATGCRVLEERRLADSGLASQHQGPALARAGRSDERVERPALARATTQRHARTCLERHRPRA